MPESPSVLMVCLGNICRSPMAEAVFRETLKARGFQGRIDSAGTGAYHQGDSPDSRTMRVLRDHGIRDYQHAARQVEEEDFLEFDYILAMDRNNLNYLQRKAERSQSGSKVMLFGDFGGHKGEEVGDPYYGARDGFTTVYDQVKRFSEGFVNEVLVPQHKPQ